LICEGRFRGEADKQGRVASTAWVEDDPTRTKGAAFCCDALPLIHARPAIMPSP